MLNNDNRCSGAIFEITGNRKITFFLSLFDELVLSSDLGIFRMGSRDPLTFSAKTRSGSEGTTNQYPLMAIVSRRGDNNQIISLLHSFLLVPSSLRRRGSRLNHNIVILAFLFYCHPWTLVRGSLSVRKRCRLRGILDTASPVKNDIPNNTVTLARIARESRLNHKAAGILDTASPVKNDIFL